MRALVFASALAGLCQAVSASASPADDYVDLVPFPRHLWDHNVIQKRDDADTPANVTLGDHEQMLWTTGDHNNHSTLVSLVTWTPQSQRIIDMAKFSFGLRAARCTEDMMLQFRFSASFQAARREWEWVNFNSMRSFVMVADHWKCGRDWSPHPWVVSRATYHAHNLTILLHAERSSWKNVTRSYMLDFGEIRRGGGGSGAGSAALARAKRQFDVNLDGAFTVNLARDWPTTFFNRTWDGTSFAVTCADCGVEGALEFAGHIEGSIFGGLDHLMLSAKPVGLGAALNLEARLQGFYDFSGKDWASQEFELVEIPLPSGWRIPGVLNFGPNAKLLAGYELTSIAGQATITAGASATIPDDSIAKLDLVSKEKVEVRGWLPTIDFEPPQLTEGGIEAKGKIWGKLAVAVSLEIFDEDGVTADVYVKIPLSIEADVGYNVMGYCEGSTDPFGASLEIDVGAEIGLEAWKEDDGEKDVFFEQVIFSDYDLVEIPELCLSFGEAPEGACMPDDMDEETGEWWANEVDPEDEDEDDDDDLTTSAAIIRRAKKDRDFDYYTMSCAPKDKKKKVHSKWPIKLKSYPSVPTMRRRKEAGPTVPIMKVGIDGCANPTAISACVPTNWVVTHEKTQAKMDGVTSWNAEHVYEGNWVADYLDHIQKNHFAGDDGCDEVGALWDIGYDTGYASELLSSVGTLVTYREMMTIFPLKENGYKFRTFAPGIDTIDGGYNPDRTKPPPYSVHDAACNLGRLVATCRYLQHTETQKRLGNSITAMEAVLTRVDADPTVPDPGRTTYVDAHKTWFTGMWEAGILKLQKQFVTAAQYLTHRSREAEYKKLPQEIQDEVDKLAVADGPGLDRAKELCHGTLVWPGVV